MKIVTVVGARPQFIKAAMVSRELRKNHKEVIVHTGQHFDYNMSKLFFDELSIPKPDYNLGISGGTHAQMTGSMMVAIEEVLQEEKPDCLLIYGDTNSTLAAALAGAKLYIPICHIEACSRNHSKTNPEEINRKASDHVSSLLLVASPTAMKEAEHEGLSENAVFIGNTMYDAFLKYSRRLEPKDITLQLLTGDKASVPDDYYYMTCHREENTGTDKNLKEILDAMNSLEHPVIFPVHPRNKERVIRLNKARHYHNLLFSEPVGYLESTCLIRHCNKVVTDSGGLMSEAFFAQKKCVTILDMRVWPDTLVDGRNELCHPIKGEILAKLNNPQRIDPNYLPFGDGHAARKAVEAIETRIFGGL